MTKLSGRGVEQTLKKHRVKAPAHAHASVHFDDGNARVELGDEGRIGVDILRGKMKLMLGLEAFEGLPGVVAEMATSTRVDDHMEIVPLPTEKPA
jgi:hypothetical protein